MAKKFNFRLEPILKLRKSAAKNEKTILTRAANLRAEKEEELESKKSYYESIIRESGGSFKAEEVQVRFHHKNYVKKQIENLKKEKDKLIEIEERQKEKYNEARKNEKVLANLKKRKREIHHKDIEKQESKQLDEIASRKKKNQDN